MLFRSAFLAATLCLALFCAHPAQAEAPRTLIQQGERFLAMGKYPAALARYSKVIECCAGTIEASEAHNDIGVVHARQGNMNLAIAQYEAALQGVPFPLAHFNLGKALTDKFRESGDEDVKKKALFHLQTFQTYLTTAEKLPPAVNCQRAEIEAFLAASIEFLIEKK
jgi:tetratricopeptide (TPR) repeat protein